nr:hypothetical protein [Methanoculleus sp.]
MHLDLLQVPIEECTVLEPTGIEVRPELPVDHGKDVFVERGGHPGRIVVCGFKHRDRFHHIQPDEEAVAVFHHGSHAPEYSMRRRIGEVPDGAPEERDEPLSPAGNAPDIAGEVPHDPKEMQPRVPPEQPLRCGGQGGLAHVHGYIPYAFAARSRRRIDELRDLLVRSRPQLHEVALPERFHEYSACLRENGEFQPGLVILGKPADLLEQLRTPAVVEVPARDTLLLRGHPGQDIRGEVVPVARGEVVAKLAPHRGGHHVACHSLTSMPTMAYIPPAPANGRP